MKSVKKLESFSSMKLDGFLENITGGITQEEDRTSKNTYSTAGGEELALDCSRDEN